MDKRKLKKTVTNPTPITAKILRFFTSPLRAAASVIRIIPKTTAASVNFYKVKENKNLCLLIKRKLKPIFLFKIKKKEMKTISIFLCKLQTANI